MTFFQLLLLAGIQKHLRPVPLVWALLRLNPTQFGSPTSRPREYRLTWDSSRTWKSEPWLIYNIKHNDKPQTLLICRVVIVTVLNFLELNSCHKDMTFDELATLILAKPEQSIPLTPECLAISSPGELFRIWGSDCPGPQHLPESLVTFWMRQVLWHVATTNKNSASYSESNTFRIIGYYDLICYDDWYILWYCLETKRLVAVWHSIVDRSLP